MYIGYPRVIMTGYQPIQPVPYSHKLHAGDLGMDCYYCHYTANKSGSRRGSANRSLHELPHAGEAEQSPARKSSR